MAGLRGMFLADQKAAAGETTARRAAAVGATRVDVLPQPLVDLVRALVADAEPACRHVNGPDGWATNAKLLLYGCVTCTDPRCIVALEMFLVQNGLLRTTPPQCGLCSTVEDVTGLSLALEEDALTAYFSVCAPCIDGLTA